jgi:hypothetical protein
LKIACFSGFDTFLLKHNQYCLFSRKAQMKRKLLWLSVELTLCFLLFGASARAQDDTLRILFLGNSHTYYNNLPHMFALLAESGGHPVMADSNAPAGYTLEGHTTNPVTLSKIAQGGWNYVVLQENSMYPVIDFYRYGSMYPAAHHLDSLIEQVGAIPALFMTWGWRGGGQRDLNGHYSAPFADYFEMQDTLSAAYEMLAGEMPALLVRAGRAWERAMRLDTTLDLWQQTDNYHPNLQGSYLAACVFYAEIFNQSPMGLEYTAGVEPAMAAFLQSVALYIVHSVEDEPGGIIPQDIGLLQNYPNPFNSTTNLTLNSPTDAAIAIYDITGKQVATLDATNGRAIWDADGYSSGIYYARVVSGLGHSITAPSHAIKLVLLK